jgi:hypothetical protein
VQSLVPSRKLKVRFGDLSDKITLTLHLSPGVESFDVDLETQTVIVKGPAGYDYIHEKIKKTGKEVSILLCY